MAFYSKALSAAKSYIGNVVGGAKIVGNAVKNAVSGGGNQSASAGMAFPLLPGVGLNGPNQSIAPNMTVAPNANDPGGPGYAYNGGGISINAPAMVYNRTLAAGQTPSSSSGASPIYSAPVTLGSGQSRNSTQALATPNFSTASTTMGADTLSTTPSSVSLPSAPSYSNPGTINNGGLINSLVDTHVYNPNTNTFDLTPKVNVSSAEQQRIDEQKQLMDMIPQKDSILNTPEIKAQQAEVNQRKQEVANYTAQLNNVVAQQNADLLKTRADLSANGGTEAVYGGIQATINREAAIKALPIQAQVAAAQGNLSLAQDYLTQLTTWKTEQITNDYNYKIARYNSISDFVKGENKIKLDAKIKAEDRAFEMTKLNLGIQDDVAKELAKQSPAAIAQITALNPGSPTFRKDMANILVKAGVSSGTANNMLNQDLQAYAASYAATGALPSPSELKLARLSAGQIANAAKELPKPVGTLVDINTNIKPSKLSAAQTDAVVALKDLSNKLTDAQTLFKDLHTGLIAGTKNALFPSQKQQEYDALRSEIVDLLARARTGAAINASEEALYLGKVPGKLNNTLFIGSTGENKLAGLKSSIEGKLNTSLKTNGLSIYGYSPVKVGDKQYTVGDVLSNDGGKTSYRVNPDGSLTQVQ